MSFMEKYTAINIGPIISTLCLARKPRELWAASYMFSYFMECILKEIDEDLIISPAIDEKEKIAVGLYPDRVFVKGDVDVAGILKRAFGTFAETVDKGGFKVNQDYINTMYVTIDFDENQVNEKDKDTINASPIKKLNYLLDCTELSNRTIKPEAWQNVVNFIRIPNNSPLYKCTGNSKMYVPMLGEIATHNVSGKEKEKWKQLCDRFRNPNNQQDEGEFYKEIKQLVDKDFKSFYKYVCVVQADGDRMGSIISSLPVNQVKTISIGLLDYCKDACRLIKNYGGFPIYAGGDDLLFIAPVVSGYGIDGDSAGIWSERKLNTIFDLLESIDASYQNKVDVPLDKMDCLKDENGKRVHTTLSYGLSITYYKYPLYEALERARKLLEDEAKSIKNAIAWSFCKHSGSELKGLLSKDASPNSLYVIFRELMNYSIDDSLISAVAHKLRENDELLRIILGQRTERLDAFYSTVMEMEEGDASYKDATKRLLVALYKEKGKEGSDISKIVELMYGILRTAKFINGEEDKDE